MRRRGMGNEWVDFARLESSCESVTFIWLFSVSKRLMIIEKYVRKSMDDEKWESVELTR